MEAFSNFLSNATSTQLAIGTTVLAVILAVWYQNRFKLFVWLDNVLAATLIDPRNTPMLAPVVKNKSSEMITVSPDEIVNPYGVWEMPFSPFDYCVMNTPLDYSYHYDYDMDIDRLKTSLRNVLKRIPIIGGKLVQSANTRLAIEYSRPQIQFIHGDAVGEPVWEPKKRRHRLFHHNFNTQTKKKMPFLQDGAQLVITVSKLPESGGTMICLGCHHCLWDGHGLMIFMQCWAAEYRGEEWTTPSWDRRVLERKDDDLIPVEELSEWILGQHTKRALADKWYLTHLQMPPRKWDLRRWHFDKAAIAKLKQFVNEGSCGEKFTRMSANDVLLSYFWRFRALLSRDYRFDEPVNMYMPLDVRYFYREQLGEPFLGNALVFCEAIQTRDKLVHEDLSAAAWKIRELTNEMNPKSINEAMSVIQHNINKGVQYWHAQIFPWGDQVYDRDLMVSNCSKLPSLKGDFGQGGPVQNKFLQTVDLMTLCYCFSETDGRIEFRTTIPVEDADFYDELPIEDVSYMLEHWDELVEAWYTQPEDGVSKTYNPTVRKIPVN